VNGSRGTLLSLGQPRRKKAQDADGRGVSLWGDALVHREVRQSRMKRWEFCKAAAGLHLWR
jgi:hypothetical protein